MTAFIIYRRTHKGLSKREMFDDQTPSNIVWWPNILPFGHLVWCCLIVFDRGRVWWNLKAIKHSIKRLKTFLLFSCLMGDVLVVWTAVSNMFGARMCTTLAQWLVFDQTCFHRLATHFNISMFDDQTPSNIVWSPNNVWWRLVVKHFPFGQALRGSKILFCRRGLNFFLRGNNSERKL